MLNFIEGKPGSGKTTYIIKNELGSHIDAGKSAIFIVPRQLTFDTDEKVLDLLGPKTACDVEVLSFKRLAETVFHKEGGLDRKLLKDGVNAIIMSNVVDALQDRLKVYNKKSNIVMISHLVEQVKFFKSNNVAVEDLKDARTSVSDTLKEKLGDIILIYDTYNKMVAEKYYDESDLLGEVYKVLEKTDYFSGKVVAMDGFSQLTVQEMKILSLAVRTADEAYITVCSEDLTNKDKSSPFAYVNESYRRFVRCVKNDIGSDFSYNIIRMSDVNPELKVYASPCLELLESSVYRTDARSDMSHDEIVLFSGASVDDECDFVAREIKKMIRSGEHRCKDITIAFRSFDEYQGRLANSMRKYGVPYFEDKRQPVVNSPLIIYVTALLQLSVPGNFTTELIMKYLKTGLSKVSEYEIPRLENYVFSWSIEGSAWKNDFTGNPEGYGKEFSDKSKEILEKINSARSRFVPDIVEFSSAVSDCSGIEFCTEIYNYLQDNCVPSKLKKYAITLEESGNKELALEQDQVWEILMDVLDEIASTLGENTILPKDFLDIFNLVISTKSLGKLPVHFDEVTVCSFDRLMNYTPKVLFSVGCNEGSFPRYQSRDGVFNEFEKGELLQTQEEKDIRLVEDDVETVIYEHFLVYQALASAREKLYVTCSQTDLDGNKQQPSDIFSMVKRIFNGIDFVPADTSAESLIQSEKTAFEYYVRHINEGTGEVATLSAYFEGRDDYKGRLSAIKTIREKKPFELENKVLARELFGETLNVSASSIEKYYDCPFEYFCNYALNLKSREKYTLDSRNTGTIAHDILEQLVRKYGRMDFVNMGNEQLFEEAKELLEDYLETKMGGKEDKTAAFLHIYHRLNFILRDTIMRMSVEFSDSEFDPCDFELTIGDGKEVSSLKIPLDEGYIELRGKIDRVDKLQLGDVTYLKIVDYKTGSKEFRLQDAVQGLNLQMILYLMAIMENGKEKYGEFLKPAGLLYLMVKGIILTDGKHTSGDLIKADQQTGLLLNNPQVLSATNAISNKAEKFTEEDYALITDKVKSLVEEMGNSLHDGLIPAKPYVEGDVTPCKYCEYSSICMKAEGVETRKIRQAKYKDVIDKLKEEQENG